MKCLRCARGFSVGPSLMRLLLSAMLALLIAMPARAAQFESLVLGAAQFTVIRVDPAKEQLRLFLDDEEGRPLQGFGPLVSQLKRQQRGISFAMNAGMYQPDLRPVGLLVVDGITRSPLNLASGEGNFFLKPNGVFYLTSNGAGIAESSDFANLKLPVLLATQSGPLLVVAGRIHPAFNASSISRLIRNGVGVTANGQVVFAISESPVSFYEFATLFRDRLHCDNALYLDGVVSSLYAPKLGRHDRRAKLGPMIGLMR